MCFDDAARLTADFHERQANRLYFLGLMLGIRFERAGDVKHLEMECATGIWNHLSIVRLQGVTYIQVGVKGSVKGNVHEAYHEAEEPDALCGRIDA